VKDIHDATASMMGGLTPLYAPPEVFDGRPSRWSDQYSLAIVYQEMLTGELPFPGTTAVQLARQHLNARPRLTKLPEHDQAVIARSLAKNPKDRYANCRALVEQLIQDHSSAQVAIPDGPTAGVDEARRSTPSRPKSQTAVLDEVPDARYLMTGTQGSPVPRVNPSPELTTLPPIELDSETVTPRPTLYLGMGRTAGRVLMQFRRRLADRYGALERIPAFQVLLADTNLKDLMELSVGNDRGALTPQETIGLPLRRPQDYRNDSRRLLEWLSRRWLYNIPRSLQTEGLRPLGRLAFVDHAPELLERIREALQQAVADESIQASTESTGLPFQAGACRVVLVGSISGGTGGGMIIDLAYAARHLLGELGLPDHDVCGIMMHSTGRNARSRELAIVNAYSALRELNHYGRLGSVYPGDRAIGLPPRRDDNVAFRDAYLVHLGDELNEAQLDGAAKQVAEYIYLDAATSASPFFRACRDAEPRNADSRNAELRIRTFGLQQFSCLSEEVISVVTEHLGRYAVDRWMTGSEMAEGRLNLRQSGCAVRETNVRQSTTSFSNLEPAAEQFANQLEMDVDSLIQSMVECIESELGGSATDFFQRHVAEAVGEEAQLSHASFSESITRISQLLDSLLGAATAGESCKPREPGTLEMVAGPFRQNTAKQLASEIRRWVLTQVDDESIRIQGAQWLARWMGARCKATDEKLKKLQENVELELAQVDAQLQMLLATLAKAKGRQRENGSAPADVLNQRCRLRLYQYVVAGVSSVVQSVKGQASLIDDDVVDLGRTLRHLGDQFDTSRTLDDLVAESKDNSMSSRLRRLVASTVVEQISQIADLLNQRLQHEVLAKCGGLRNLLTEGRTQNALPTQVRRSVRRTLVEALQRVDVAGLLFDDIGAGDQEADVLKECVQAARPKLMACGGAKRLLVLLPEGSRCVRPLEVLHQEFNETPSAATNGSGDFVVCYEVEQMSLTQAAVTLIDGRRDFAEFAARLHTRTDVDWANLPDLV
jgi:hypothetical protein